MADPHLVVVPTIILRLPPNSAGTKTAIADRMPPAVIPTVAPHKTRADPLARVRVRVNLLIRVKVNPLTKANNPTTRAKVNPLMGWSARGRCLKAIPKVGDLGPTDLPTTVARKTTDAEMTSDPTAAHLRDQDQGKAIPIMALLRAILTMAPLKAIPTMVPPKAIPADLGKATAPADPCLALGAMDLTANSVKLTVPTASSARLMGQATARPLLIARESARASLARTVPSVQACRSVPTDALHSNSGSLNATLGNSLSSRLFPNAILSGYSLISSTSPR